eukprot:scaffold152668_cov36-Tisochrysis_lutea.AAC.2
MALPPHLMPSQRALKASLHHTRAKAIDDADSSLFALACSGHGLSACSRCNACSRTTARASA